MQIQTLEIVGTNVPSPVARGQQVEVTVNVQNVFVAPVNCDVTYYISAGGPLVLNHSDQGVVSIDVNEIKTFTFTYTVPMDKGGIDDGTPFTLFGLVISALDGTTISDTETFTISVQQTADSSPVLNSVVSAMVIMMLMTLMINMISEK